MYPFERVLIVADTPPSHLDPLDILRLPGGSRDPAPALYADKDWRGRGHHNTLSLCPWRISRLVPRQLDLPLLH